MEPEVNVSVSGRDHSSRILHRVVTVLENESESSSETIWGQMANAVADHVGALFLTKSNPKPQKVPQLLLLIHGWPGVGKTWTVNTIRALLSDADIGTCSTAFTGAAASLISEAETTHSMFSIPPRWKKRKTA
jgi:hypothetical protein